MLWDNIRDFAHFILVVPIGWIWMKLNAHDNRIVQGEIARAELNGELQALKAGIIRVEENVKLLLQLQLEKKE